MTPGTNEAIKAFCSTKYHVTFPMFAKVSVRGAIRWNFTKFLADRNGMVISRFGSSVEPESAELVNAIEAALK